MKKVLILCVLLILCIGCTRIDNIKDYKVVIDNVIERNNIDTNTASMGYKYYLPIGVRKVYDKDYNQKFRYEDVDIYLYVDAVSYYYHNTLNFNEDKKDNDFYYKIVNSDKIGYVIVTKNADDYFVKIVYNYAKIESHVPKEKLNEVIANSMIILNSINYNDNLIKKILEDEYYSSTAKEYKIKKPDNTTSKFSEYLSEYVVDEETTVPDLPEY